MLYNALITGANGLIGREFSSFVDTKSSFLTTHKNFDILDYQQMKKFVEGKKSEQLLIARPLGMLRLWKITMTTPLT